jgi:heptosyltransferase I
LNVDLSRATSLLIVKPSSLGDVVHTIPAASLISSAYPHLKIQWLVNPEWAPLIDELPWLSATIPFPRSRFRGIGGPRKLLSWRNEFSELLGSPPDVTLDFQGLLRSGLASRWSRAPVRIGLSDSREGARFFHSEVVTVDPQAHAVDRYLNMVRALGIEIPHELPWELPAGTPIPDECLSNTSPARAIVLHPFSRGDGKSLTRDQIVRFCNACADVPVILVGRSESVNGLPLNTCDLTNRTSLQELVWLMRRAGWIVSVDSGPMHIAAAASPRVLGIHTWSDPCKVGPYRPEAWIYKGGHIFHRSDCPATLRNAHCRITNSDIDKIADFTLANVASNPLRNA